MLRKLLICLWIVIFASSAKADEAPKLEFSVEFDENGKVQLMAPKGTGNDASISLKDKAHSADKTLKNEGSFGFEDITSVEQTLREFDGYNVRDASGNTALIMVPAGQAPALWTSEKNTFGLSQVPDGVVRASMLGSTREAAQEILRQLSEAAYAEYCGNSIRPNEFSIEVSMGAELFVKGSATLSAKFITEDMCKD